MSALVVDAQARAINYHRQLAGVAGADSRDVVKGLPQLLSDINAGQGGSHQEKIAQVCKVMTEVLIDQHLTVAQLRQSLRHSEDRANINGDLCRELHVKNGELQQENDELKRDCRQNQQNCQNLEQQLANLMGLQAQDVAKHAEYKKVTEVAQQKRLATQNSLDAQIRILQAEVSKLKTSQEVKPSETIKKQLAQEKTAGAVDLLKVMLGGFVPQGFQEAVGA